MTIISNHRMLSIYLVCAVWPRDQTTYTAVHAESMSAASVSVCKQFVPECTDEMKRSNLTAHQTNPWCNGFRTVTPHTCQYELTQSKNALVMYTCIPKFVHRYK